MTSSSLLQLPVPLSPRGGSALPFSAAEYRGTHTGTIHFPLLSLHVLASLGLKPLWGPRISPAAETLGPKAPGGSRWVPTHPGGADQGCLPGIGSWISGDLRRSDRGGRALLSPQLAQISLLRQHALILYLSPAH